MTVNHNNVLPRSVADNEPLGRFIFSKRHFNKTDQSTKYAAFLPYGEPLAVSVFRLMGLGPGEVVDLGRQVGQARSSGLKAYAELPASSVKKAQLLLHPDDTPPRHASIENWPMDKHEQQMKALSLSRDSRLHIVEE